MAGMTFPDFVAQSCCNACCPTGVTAQVVDAAATGACGCQQGAACGCGCCCCCRCNGNVQGAQTRPCNQQTTAVGGTSTACCRNGTVDPIWGCRPRVCGGIGSNPLNPCCGWGGIFR